MKRTYRLLLALSRSTLGAGCGGRMVEGAARRIVRAVAGPTLVRR